jgi:hypothetical protein
MAYTSPSQWLDLIRRRPGSRITGPMDGGPGGILNATGQFMQRNSANPTRSWREIAAEGAARRGASSAYGAEIPMGAGVQPVMEPSSRTSSSYADTMRKLPDSSLHTSSNVGDVPDDRSFMDKIGGFFGREGTPEMLMRAGARMSQAASQPGASFLGSLGAGVEAGVDQSMANRAALAQRQALAAETASDRAKLQQEITARQQAVRSIGAERGIDGAKIAEYVAMAATKEGYEYVMSQIAPELSSAQASVGVDRQNWDYYQQMLTDADGDPDKIALAEQFWNSTQSSGSRPTGPIQIENRLRELADPGWELGMPYNDAQTAFLQISENIPSVLRGQMQSPGQIEADKLMVGEMQAWDSQGRFAFTTKLAKYDEILSVLDDQNNITGALVGTVMDHGWIPESVKALAVGDAINTLDTIRSIVFESLRDTLGAQFTEKEGDRLVAAAYNQYLPEEMNRARMMRMRDQLVKTADAKNRMVTHWNNYGTFASYENPYQLGEGGDLPLAHLMIEASDYAGVDSDKLSQYIAADIDNFSAAEARALYVDLADEEETEAVREMRRQLLAKVG